MSYSLNSVKGVIEGIIGEYHRFIKGKDTYGIRTGAGGNVKVSGCTWAVLPGA